MYITWSRILNEIPSPSSIPCWLNSFCSRILPSRKCRMRLTCPGMRPSHRRIRHKRSRRKLKKRQRTRLNCRWLTCLSRCWRRMCKAAKTTSSSWCKTKKETTFWTTDMKATCHSTLCFEFQLLFSRLSSTPKPDSQIHSQ